MELEAEVLERRVEALTERGEEPDVTSVVPGDTIHTAQGTAGVELPSYLASFGYAVGLLHEGRNDIPVKVWIARVCFLTVEGPAGYSCPSAGILVGSA